MKVLIDIDGVVYPFVPRLQAFAERMLEKELPTVTQWEIWRDWGMTKNAWYDLYNMFIDQGYLRFGNPISEAQTAIQDISKRHEVIFCTARDMRTKQHTVPWIKENFGKNSIVVFAEDKSTLGADILIDDSVNQLDTFGRGAIRYSQRWNAAWSGPALTWHTYLTSKESYEGLR